MSPQSELPSSFSTRDFRCSTNVLGCKFVAKPKHFVKKSKPLAYPKIDSPLQAVPTKRMIVEENRKNVKINFQATFKDTLCPGKEG
jgi:hypothetical protein